MKHLTAIIFFPWILFFAAAQKPTLVFEKKLHDFGQVQQWSNPPAVFLFTNTGSETLFLPTRQREDIFVSLPQGKIKPGQTDTVVLYFFTDKLGEFQQSVELFTGNSNSPVTLTVKGNILKLDANAFISCPGFAPKTERVDELALLLDSLSGKSIEVQTITTQEDVMEFEEPEIQETNPVISKVGPSIAQPMEEENSVLPQNLYAPNNIIFLIDISYSMKKPDKLPLLKISMKNLTQALRKIDRISVIVYSTTSAVLLPSTPANNKEALNLLIDTLKPHGITNGVKGLETAYQLAEQNFIPGGNNQIIIATDGIFNSPSFTESAIYSLVREKAESDIILSVVGFGEEKDAVKMMKKMADKGNGSFIQIPDKLSADAILIEEIKAQSAIAK
ncbi:MAG: VWA domain-containing protein [Chitinophagales bacterium]|nr:VWA domain-containing protein [Chitinophagales bacterium]